MNRLFLIALLLLTSCKSDPVVQLVKVPVVVEIPAKKESKQDIKIPDSLKKPCPIEEMKVLTKEELVRIHNANLQSLKDCSQDKKDAIQELKDAGLK